jgi:hypothetical protein
MDEVSIRNTIARFADSVTRFENDMFRTVWADDAEFIIGHAPHRSNNWVRDPGRVKTYPCLRGLQRAPP